MRKEIEYDKHKLAYIKQRGMNTTSSLNAIKSPGVSDKVADSVIEYAITEAKMKEHIIACAKLEYRITEFIDTIPDARTRLIFKLRFLDNRSWVNVAWKVGGYASEDSVKKTVYRYIERNSNR